jgi:hypothetical protein
LLNDSALAVIYRNIANVIVLLNAVDVDRAELILLTAFATLAFVANATTAIAFCVDLTKELLLNDSALAVIYRSTAVVTTPINAVGIDSEETILLTRLTFDAVVVGLADLLYPIYDCFEGNDVTVANLDKFLKAGKRDVAKVVALADIV